jgi:hypothetical protein
MPFKSKIILLIIKIDFKYHFSVNQTNLHNNYFIIMKSRKHTYLLHYSQVHGQKCDYVNH